SLGLGYSAFIRFLRSPVGSSSPSMSSLEGLETNSLLTGLCRENASGQPPAPKKSLFINVSSPARSVFELPSWSTPARHPQLHEPSYFQPKPTSEILHMLAAKRI